MKITSVKVLLTGNDDSGKGSSIKASVSVVIDGSFIMRGISIIQKRNSSDLLVLMPVRQRKNGKVSEYYHPVSREARSQLTTAILDAYHLVKRNPKETIVWFDKTETIPTISRIKIDEIKDDRLVKAIVTVVLDDAFMLNQIRIIHDTAVDKIWIAMPAKKIIDESSDKKGELLYLEFFHPISSELRAVMTDTILSAFEKFRKTVPNE